VSNSQSCLLDSASLPLYGTRSTILRRFRRQEVSCLEIHSQDRWFEDNIVSLQQMVLFGQNPNQGTLLKASQFLAGTYLLHLFFVLEKTHPSTRGTTRTSRPPRERARRAATQSPRHAFDTKGQKLVRAVLRGESQLVNLDRQLIHPWQELITFPPIVLPPNIQALLMSRPDDVALPESKPNPNDRYTHINNHSSGSPYDGKSGFNKLKLRVPMERRCVYRRSRS